MEQIKNKIVIYNGSFENKKRIELYNFNKMEHICIDGRAFIRITCDGRYYHYKVAETTISKIEIY